MSTQAMPVSKAPPAHTRRHTDRLTTSAWRWLFIAALAWNIVLALVLWAMHMMLPTIVSLVGVAAGAIIFAIDRTPRHYLTDDPPLTQEEP